MHPAAVLANRALEREDWAREKLAAHAGRTLSIAAGPATITLGIDTGGSFVDAAGEADLTLTISPLRLPELLARPERWSALVTAAGDAGLAATIGELAQTLPWFVERAFARAFGAIVGQQLADAGRSLLALPGYAFERTGASIASFARDEAALSVRTAAGRDFSAQVGSLAARVDELAARIDRLGARAAKPPS